MAYVTTGSAKLDAFVRDLRAVLQRFRDADATRFDFSIIDTTRDEAARKSAKDAGLLRFADGEPDEARLDGYMGLVLDYGGTQETLKLLAPEEPRGLEYAIALKLLEARSRGEQERHRIGVLTGHDEIKLSDPNLVSSSPGVAPTLAGILKEYFPWYELVDVDLRKTPGAPIDHGLEGLVVTQPGTDLTDDELRRIDAFVLEGKALTVAASAVNLAAYDPTMQATLSTHGLEKLVGGYGIEMRSDVLEDFGHQFNVPIASANGVQTARFPAILAVKDDSRFTGDNTLLDTGFAPFFRITDLAIPFASSLVLHRERQPSVGPSGLRIVARSTPKTSRETVKSVNLAPLRQWRAKEPFAQYDVAAVVEGQLGSAFAAAGTATSPRPARVLVISSSQFFANPFARAGSSPPSKMGEIVPSHDDETLQQLAMPYAQRVLTSTILVFKNTLDWMTMDRDLARCTSLPNDAR